MIITGFVILSLLLNLTNCNGFKILVVFPFPSRSHGILGDNIVKHLKDAGHEVTYITPFIDKKVDPKVKIMDVSENRKLFSENSMNIKLFMDKDNKFEDVDSITNFMINISSQTLESPNIQKIIHDPNQKFDVVIGQWMFSDLYCVFAAIFECPLIWLSTVEPHWLLLNMVDGPTNPAYTNTFLSQHIHPLSFVERVNELWAQLEGLIRKNCEFYYKEEEIYQRLIVPVLKQKGRPIPSYEVLRQNTSLILGNTQVVIGEAIALPQNYKHIGGYHINEEVEPLPENLKSILDKARHGVIYFSLGSNFKSKDLPEELKQGILKVFGGLKQTVLWKFEDVLSDIRKNVHVVQWAPQQSILAHQNLVLFITHGGLLSITEAVHYGVPLIVIPVFADQFSNALRVEKKGYGKKIKLSYKMYEDLKISIEEVLSNPEYTKRAKEMSLAYHDRPMKPKDELLFWIEHVVRTRGALHLRSPALQLPLYQRLYVDLFVVILVLFIVIKTSVSYIFCKFSKKILDKKEKYS